MPIPFNKYKYLFYRDLERCPYPMGTVECWDWNRRYDEDMLLLALERYTNHLRERAGALDIRRFKND